MVQAKNCCPSMVSGCFVIWNSHVFIVLLIRGEKALRYFRSCRFLRFELNKLLTEKVACFPTAVTG